MELISALIFIAVVFILVATFPPEVGILIVILYVLLTTVGAIPAVDFRLVDNRQSQQTECGKATATSQ